METLAFAAPDVRTPPCTTNMFPFHTAELRPSTPEPKGLTSTPARRRLVQAPRALVHPEQGSARAQSRYRLRGLTRGPWRSRRPRHRSRLQSAWSGSRRATRVPRVRRSSPQHSCDLTLVLGSVGRCDISSGAGHFVSVEEERADFERLVRAHHDAVLAYVLRRAAPEDAADALADTFLVAWRRFKDAPDDKGRLPWLYGIARRTLANQRRAHTRRAALEQRLARDVPEFDADETDHAVMVALASLAEADREALMLTTWEGLTTAEAAHALGCRPATLRMRLVRARRRLATLLEEPPAISPRASSLEHRP